MPTKSELRDLQAVIDEKVHGKRIPGRKLVGFGGMVGSGGCSFGPLYEKTSPRCIDWVEVKKPGGGFLYSIFDLDRSGLVGITVSQKAMWDRAAEHQRAGNSKVKSFNLAAEDLWAEYEGELP